MTPVLPRNLVLALFAGAGLTVGCRPSDPPRHVGAADVETETGIDADTGAAHADPHADNAVEDAESTPSDAPAEEPSVEEQLALDALRTKLPAATPADEEPLAFRVIQNGPGQPWILGVVNRGELPATLVADPRLVSFEVAVPGKKKPVTCKLPASLRPERAQRGYSVLLEPGQGVVKAFDPRLYCFAVSGQHVLVPGAIISPHFGWPEAVKTVWKGGKPQKVKLQQSEPFIASILASESEAHELASDASDAPARSRDAAPDPAENAPSVRHLKELVAPAIALDSEYSQWSSAGIREQKSESPITIEMNQGSDADSQLTATVAIQLKNRSKRAQYIYFRRELLSFEVMGPGGAQTCDPQPDTRAPDRQAFLYMGAGQSMTIASRLVELCPKGTFERPGFYLVHARFDADDDGEEFGFDAYVGRVATEQPANVRIRSGELDPNDREAMRPIQVLK